MNMGAISQPPMTPDGAAAIPSRNTGAQDGDAASGGGFAGLLSRLASDPKQDGRQAAPDKDGRVNVGDKGQLAIWLQGNTDAMEDEVTSAAEALLDRTDSAVGGLTDIDLAALVQLLNGNGILAAAGGIAALAERVASGTATEAETAMVQAALRAQDDGAASSPEKLILTALAKANGHHEEVPGGDAKTKTINATLTILGRETHLAPVAEPQTGLAARFAAEGVIPVRTRGAPNAGQSGDATQVQAAGGVDTSEAGRIANPQIAVTAARDGQLDGQWQQRPSPTADKDAGPIEQDDAISGMMAGAGAQVSATGRPDALVNAGLASPYVQQIADRVAAEASTLVAQSGRPDVPAFGVKHESAVKVLHLQLQPADLGVVTIRMSVKDNALRLDLEAGRGETANLIQRDRDALSALLRSAGYLIDGVDIRVADQSGLGAQSSGNGQSNAPMHGGGQSGSSQPEGRSPGEQSHGGRGNNAFAGRHHEDEQAVPPARSSGLYI